MAKINRKKQKAKARAMNRFGSEKVLKKVEKVLSQSKKDVAKAKEAQKKILVANVQAKKEGLQTQKAQNLRAAMSNHVAIRLKLITDLGYEKGVSSYEIIRNLPLNMLSKEIDNIIDVIKTKESDYIQKIIDIAKDNEELVEYAYGLSKVFSKETVGKIFGWIGDMNKTTASYYYQAFLNGGFTDEDIANHEGELKDLPGYEGVIKYLIGDHYKDDISDQMDANYKHLEDELQLEIDKINGADFTGLDEEE